MFKNTHLSLCDIDDKWQLIIDPNNVFWSLLDKNKNPCFTVERKILPLYKEVKEKLDKQIREFRSETNLTSIYINPTDRCNADCGYCYVPAGLRKNGRQMNQKQMDYVLEKSIEYFKEKRKNSKTKPVIIFHASEPLLAKDIIFNAISRFRGYFHFGVQTNTVLLEEKDISFLKEYKINVGISLDSHLPKINNLLRKTTANQSIFDKVMRVIDSFDGYPGLNVLSTITKHNVKQMPEFVDFLAKKKIKSVLLNPVRCTNEKTLSLRPDNEILLKYFINAVEESIKLSKSSKKIIVGNFANIIIGIIAPAARRLMCDITPCGGARCFITVTANGDFIPCGEFVGLDEFRCGNIFNSTIQEAVDSESAKKVRTRIVEKINECDTCLFRNICGAPCPAEVYSLNKNLYQISPYCGFYKELIKYAFKLIAEDKIKYILREEALKNLEYEYKLNN